MNLESKNKHYWEKYFKTGKIKEEPDEAIVKIVPLMKKMKFEKILDLGCGGGRHLVYLAKKGFSIIGCDISSTALKKAQIWLDKEKIINYCLVKHNIPRLPFLDGYFDVVISVYAIEHSNLYNVKRTIDEVFRVLKKGGIFLTTIVSTKDYKFKIGKKIEKNTYLFHDTLHHFFDEKDIKILFNKFSILKFEERVEIKSKDELIHTDFLKKINGDTVKNVHLVILAKK